jgi:hypothetical protein
MCAWPSLGSVAFACTIGKSGEPGTHDHFEVFGAVMLTETRGVLHGANSGDTGRGMAGGLRVREVEAGAPGFSGGASSSAVPALPCVAAVLRLTPRLQSRSTVDGRLHRAPDLTIPVVLSPTNRADQLSTTWPSPPGLVGRLLGGLLRRFAPNHRRQCGVDLDVGANVTGAPEESWYRQGHIG